MCLLANSAWTFEEHVSMQTALATENRPSYNDEVLSSSLIPEVYLESVARPKRFELLTPRFVV